MPGLCRQLLFYAWCMRVSDGVLQSISGNICSPCQEFTDTRSTLVCTLAWVMHYNSPRFYTELAEATIPRFTTAVMASFGLAAAVNVAIAVAGFLTFGGHSDGLILNNYSDYDPLATFCRLAVVVSTLLTFPIVFIGFRDGVVDVFRVPMEKQTEDNVNLLTVVLLASLTVTAIFWTDLGMINAVGGGTLAAPIVFIFPATMYRAAVQGLGDGALSRQRTEVVMALALMVFGVLLGLMGVVQVLFPVS